MINIELPSVVRGDKLVGIVEAAMSELEGFEVKKKSKHQYDNEGKLAEISRNILARKKYSFLGPLTERHADLTWQNPDLSEKSTLMGFLNPVPIFYLVPFLGQVLYAMTLFDPMDGKCLISTSIELDRDYDKLNIGVWGRGYETYIVPENEAYKYFKDDVEKFVSNLGKRL